MPLHKSQVLRDQEDLLSQDQHMEIKQHRLMGIG